ncbi:MAG: outer membrane lipoprotein carrier protein LolA [Polyangiaceae bacterium]
MRGRFARALALALTCAVLGFAGDLAEARGDTPSPQTTIDSVDALFATLARSPGLFARFHEEKQIALLVAPLKNDGTIHFDKHHGLARHTLAPQKQSVLLSGSTLTLWDGAKTETVSLQSSAPLRALAQAFSLLLAADRPGLEKSFSLAFQTKGQAWRLVLVPTAADLRKLVTEVDVAGEGATPKTLVVHEASGDESTTTLSDVDLDKRYTEREAAAVFKVPPTALN